MVDLQRGVLDGEVLVQFAFEVSADVVAVVVAANEHVRRQRWEAGRDFPDVQVVDLAHPGRVHERLPDGAGVKALGRCFEEHPAGVAQQT